MDYIKENAYMITKMLLNQFGAAFLGLVLYLASSTGDNAFLINRGHRYSRSCFTFTSNTPSCGISERAT